jgi:hypothetical protein
MFEEDIENLIAAALTVATLLVIAKFTFLSTLPWWFILMPIWFPPLLIGIFLAFYFLVVMIKEIIWWR